jgi:hypothetical protein
MGHQPVPEVQWLQHEALSDNFFYTSLLICTISNIFIIYFKILFSYIQFVFNNPLHTIT